METKEGRDYIRKTHLEYLPNDQFWREMYSDEKIEEESCLVTRSRIGPDFQARIPELEKEVSKKKK